MSLSPKRRKYLSSYRDRNRDKYNAAHRRWRASRYGSPASKKQKQICVRTPLASLQSRFGVVKPQFVLCMICWNRAGELGHHKCVITAGGPKAYAKKVGLPSGVSLWCEVFSRRKAKVSRRKCTPHVRRFWRDNPGFLSGTAKPATWKRTPQGESISDAVLVAEWIFEKRPVERIAESHEMSAGAVMRRLQRILGFPVRRFFLAVHGEPVTKRWIRRLLSQFQITVEQLGQGLRRNRYVADGLTRRSEQDSIPRRASALAVAQFEHDLIEELLASRGAPQPRVVKAVFPAIEETYRGLLSAFTWALADGERKPFEFSRSNLDVIISRSRKEVASGGPYVWRDFLCRLPRLAAFWKRRRGSRPETASRIATAFLAFDVGCRDWVITSALLNETHALPSGELKLLVRSVLGAVAASASVPRGESQLTRQRKKLAAAYHKLGWSQSDMASHVFCDAPRSALKNTYNFFVEHGTAIKLAAKLNLTRAEAEKIVRDPLEFLNLTPEQS